MNNPQELEQVLNSIKFSKKEDWFNHQICGDFPNVDARCLTFCCSPAKPCPLRNIVLKKMNLSLEDYINKKQKSAEKFKNN